MKRVYTRLVIIASAVILVVPAFYFIFRNQLLNETVDEKVNRFNKDREANIYFKKVCFEGISTIHFDSLLVTAHSDDTILYIGSLSAEINIWQMITGHIRFRKLSIGHAGIHIVQKNINSYFRTPSNAEDSHRTDSSDINLYARADHLLKRVFAVIPSTLTVKDISVIYSLDSIDACVDVDLISLKNGKLTSSAKFINNKFTQAVLIEGKVKPGQRFIELSIKPRDEGVLLHSPLAGLFGAGVNYKSLNISFNEKDNKDNLLRLEGICSLDWFDVDYKPLSSDKVTFSGCSMKFNLSVGANYFQLDSISEIIIGKLMLHPSLRYSLSPADSITFSCFVPTFTVDEFFKSLPAELFPDLKYFEADGSLSYRMKFMVDLKQPDSLRIGSILNASNFKIKHFDSELSKMNSNFIYTAYEKGNPVRSIQVGPEDPDYRSLDQIPILLQNSILTAEDNAFYYHKGFWIESIRSAIARNLKEHKLFRGGSTISQQLIKNVYLSREKTLSRKFEEFALVWLIESNHLVSKSRMYEVYLNIIEWGPNVYGANEAARFYFKKDVGQINATECIFLASIIPSPKKFYYRFDKEGNLAPFMMLYYKDISEKLYRRGLLSSANGDSLSSLLKITGTAKEFLRSNAVLADPVQYPDILEEEIGE